MIFNRELKRCSCDCPILCALIAAAILLLSPSAATAVDKYWNFISGDWTNSSQYAWNPSTEPTSGDKAHIQSGIVSITQTGEVCQNLYLGETNTSMAQMSSGDLTVSGSSYIGYSGIGIFTQTGGTYTITPSLSLSLSLGCDSGACGIYNLSGSGQLLVPAELIGLSGTGIFNHSGGTTNTGLVNLGVNANSSGTYNLSGSGVLSNVLYEHIGFNGAGIFAHSAGTNSTNNLYVGTNSGASGIYNLNGTGLLNANIEYIGNSGTGLFTQSAGINSVNILYLGYNYTGSGAYNLIGGTLVLKSLEKGPGEAAFLAGGGTLQASSDFSTSVAMTLTGNGGNANIDTAGYAVTLSGILSGRGGLNKLGSGTLSLSAQNIYSGDTIINGGTLEFAGGIDENGTSLIDVQSGAAALKTTTVNKTNLNITTAALATFEILNGAHTVGVISGNGTTLVESGATLTVASISQGTLTIGSGATLTIQAIPGGLQGGAIAPVPEPSALLLLTGVLIWQAFAYVKKMRR
jgi:autotransporter-associated beta strand protein